MVFILFYIFINFIPKDYGFFEKKGKKRKERSQEAQWLGKKLKNPEKVFSIQVNWYRLVSVTNL